MTTLRCSPRVDLVQRQLLQGRLHHRGVQTAPTSGVDLDHGHAGGRDPVGVYLRRRIPVGGGAANAFSKGLDRAHQETGLARPRRSPQVDSQDAVRVQLPAVFGRDLIVCLSDVLDNCDLGHIQCLLLC